MNVTQQWILFGLGCVSVVVGICLMAWSAVQKKTVAGAEEQGKAGLIEALAKLVDALARYFPENAAKVGWALIIVGVGLIFGPFYLPARGG